MKLCYVIGRQTDRRVAMIVAVSNVYDATRLFVYFVAVSRIALLETEGFELYGCRLHNQVPYAY